MWWRGGGGRGSSSKINGVDKVTFSTAERESSQSANHGDDENADGHYVHGRLYDKKRDEEDWRLKHKITVKESLELVWPAFKMAAEISPGLHSYSNALLRSHHVRVIPTFCAWG